MDLSDYTAASVQALNASVHAAKQVLDDPEATPQQVAGAYDDVEEKVGQLETKKHDGSHSGRLQRRFFVRQHLWNWYGYSHNVSCYPEYPSGTDASVCGF